MIIDCISDLHGHYPQLPGGDILIIAGDCTLDDELTSWAVFFHWLKSQNYRKKILVAGNHDNYLFTAYPKNKEEREKLAEVREFLEYYGEESEDFEYLSDQETTFEGVRIYGTPWTALFTGQNPKAKAFSVHDWTLEDKFKEIPFGLDILVSHSPMRYALDQSVRGESFGSRDLRCRVYDVMPKVLICGHIHEYGMSHINYSTDDGVVSVFNVSFCDEKYNPRNKLLRLTRDNKGRFNPEFISLYPYPFR